MSNPRVVDQDRLKRLARYLIGCPRAITTYAKQTNTKWIIGWSDSDWAGCLDTRKSTSGGLIKLGSHALKAWSSTQDNIALSSAEAEFYAAVKCGSQLLGMKAMLEDLGVDFRIHLKIKIDASAAIGISMRKGLGKLRHIEVNQLWLQDAIHKGKIGIEKVDGKSNLADFLTKPADRDSMQLHIEGSSMRMRMDRHPMAPTTAQEED